MSFSFIHIIILVGASIGILLGAILWRSALFRTPANRFLAITFWTASILAINYSLMMAGMEHLAFTVWNDVMWEYLFPASMLLYFAYASEHELAKSPRRFWLFAPFVLTLLINVGIDLDTDFGYYNIPWNDEESFLEIYYTIETSGAIVFSLICFIWSYFIVRKDRHETAGRWLYQLWRWSTLIVCFWAFTWVLYILVDIDFVEILFIGITLLFFWVSYRGVFQFELAREQVDIRAILQQTPLEISDAASIVENTKVEAIDNPHLLRLEQLMQEEHLYRKPDLSRELAAQKLGISSGYLSQQLSAHDSINFSDYVNRYRVEEVKRLLTDPAFESFSLLAIGYEAGFNSKSTFYAAFKKMTGGSPSAYRQKNVLEVS